MGYIWGDFFTNSSGHPGHEFKISAEMQIKFKLFINFNYLVNLAN
jgi:hypothetical protein